ncbi:MAG: nitrite reductase small subunit NirD [Ilumatobacter sp.]
MTAIEHSVAPHEPAPDVESVQWVAVCEASHVRPDRGVAVLVDDEPVAVFRLAGVGDLAEEWRAVSHIDPVGGAPVMARGLIGSVGAPPLIVPTIASPLHKQRYNLRSGHCLDHPTALLRTYPVRVHNGVVEIGTAVTPT